MSAAFKLSFGYIDTGYLFRVEQQRLRLSLFVLTVSSARYIPWFKGPLNGRGKKKKKEMR